MVIFLVNHLLYNHPQPLLGKEGRKKRWSLPSLPRRGWGWLTSLLTKEGLGVVDSPLPRGVVDSPPYQGGVGGGYLWQI